MSVKIFLNQYLAQYKNYKDYWNYEDGCVLLGAKQLYQAVGDQQYLDFISDYLKDLISETGTIVNYEADTYNIDSINSSKILFFMYEQTGAEKYRNAIEFTMERLRKHPRCQCGSFWHKQIYPNQIWLDGLYMAQPFYMEYETKFGNKEHYVDIIDQFRHVQSYLFCEKKGLCYHAYDETRTQFWCDQETGCSKNFWLRSMGWYLMALVDVLEVMSPEIFEHYKTLEEIFKTIIKGLLRYQDPQTGMFYQVIDRSDVNGNYLETSGSAMVGYSILKACRIGILPFEKYAGKGSQIVEGIIREQLREEDGQWHLKGICHVAGLGPDTSPHRDGSVKYYLSEKIVSDDAKGVGPFMMAYAEKIYLAKDGRESDAD